MPKITKLSQLKGLGKKSEQQLNAIGIYSKADLKSTGPIGAFIKLQKSGSKPSLNFLYAMVGAIEEKHWTDIAKTEKSRLLIELDGYHELEGILKNESSKSEKYQSMRASKEFQKIPGVGNSLSQDLVNLGYNKITELKDENPETMYQNLMLLRGEHIDRCVLYVFRCAVYYASNTVHEPELLKWWNWKDEKQKI